MLNKYDLIIVGAGPSGIFTAYEIVKLGIVPGKKVLLVDQGKPVEKRACPIAKTGKCMKCRPYCMITSGFSGSGAFSDGKLTLINPDAESIEVGGELDRYLGIDYTKSLINYTDQIYLKFGADKKVAGTEFPDERKAIVDKAKANGLTVIDSPIRHLGTEKSHKLFEKIEKFLLDNGIEIAFETNVIDIVVNSGKISGVIVQDSYGKTQPRKLVSERVVVGVGRKGASWLSDMCKKHGIKSRAGAIDIGVRYELPDKYMAEVNRLFYELKAVGKLPPSGDKVRTFCQNPSGFVASEGYDGGIMCVNGHSFKNKKSTNTNLALLVSHFFGPMEDPIRFGLNVAQNINLIGNGNPIVQRLGDLINPMHVKRTWDYELAQNSVVPTLTTATPGDISFVLPKRTLDDIITFILAMDTVIPGFADPDNLLYAAEVKFYSNSLLIDNNFETSVRGLYAIGDGAGQTRGLIMASGAGVEMARILAREF